MSSAGAHGRFPVSEIDLWSDEVLKDPFATYAALRDLGPAVWLEKHDILALPRYDQVQWALTNWEIFSSAAGIGVESAFNRADPESIIISDPPEHTRYRRPIAAQLTPRRIAADGNAIGKTAAAIVDNAIAGGTFDAVADLARPYSLTVVSDLLGIPRGQRDHLPRLAQDAFNAYGPVNARSAAAAPALQELAAHAAAMVNDNEVRASPRGAELCGLEDAVKHVIAYTLPGVDTTANAIAAMVYLFARHVDQWDLVRNDASLIDGAFSEVLRMHSPVHYFTRLTSAAVEIDNLTVPANSRVLIMYGSANRDERHYVDPEHFDVTRQPRDHLAFGRGVHLCVGHNLAKLEVHALLATLTASVTRFELAGQPEWMLNNVLHGLRSLPVSAITV